MNAICILDIRELFLGYACDMPGFVLDMSEICLIYTWDIWDTCQRYVRDLADIYLIGVDLGQNFHPGHKDCT